tara:strand:- start:1551 stop:2357 length:807 start_codon:yes stop_codon:yes gene_type:complete
MGNLVFKPATGGGNKVVFQNQGGSDALTVEDSGNITLAGTANNLGTVTAGTLDDAVTYRNINQDLGSADTAYFANLVAHESTQVFTATGTWTKPTGIKKIFVELVGSGGGGSGYGEAGGAGGYSAKWINVTAIASETATIGSGGSGNTYGSGAAGSGTATSFGSHLSATGGEGAYNPGHRGGSGGIGSGGNINFQGGGGSGHNDSNNGHIGGSSYFGNGGPGCHSTSSHSHTYDRQGGPGSGGAAGNSGATYRGAHGANGYIVVWEYK